jgi:two-component system, cell cycle response regulator DivK
VKSRAYENSSEKPLCELLTKIQGVTANLPSRDEVLTAVDGVEGMRVAEHEHPDLILMDLSLPVIDGWEATRRLKANAALCDIPIIALSAHAMTGDAEKALQSGCNDYLSKPLDEDLLFAKLAKFLGQD